ncbi:hypothetical protein BC832DRAFT_289149 [Gaertneriomyces semiglobifer]|nr:hypothetical protein BC832DRAFT_289149 [Gaertneriomyces semiglobifer]
MSGSRGTRTEATRKKTSETTLQSVVSRLTRAAVGGVPDSIPDEELDKYIAETIVKEAALADKRYQQVGISAYLGKDPNSLPKPNKRFLANIIRDTDAHNERLLRSTELDRRSGTQRSRSPISVGESSEELNKPSRRARSTPGCEGSNPNIEIKGAFASHGRLTNDGASTPIHAARDTLSEGCRTPSRPRMMKGRGVSGSARLDKYFEEKYDPRYDFDNYDDSNMERYIENLEELALSREGALPTAERSSREKRRSRSKSKKSRKSDSMSSSSSSEDDARRRERRKKKKKKTRDEKDSPPSSKRKKQLSPDRDVRMKPGCPW